MIAFIDKFLNSITMYRLMLYGLLLEAGYSIVLALLGQLHFSPVSMVLALLILIAGSFASNVVFAKATRAAMNAESMFITALLLFFVFDPTVLTVRSALLLLLVSVIAQASKYVFAIGRRHIFNPIAITAFLFDLLQIPIVMWWVATPWLLPVALVFGLMVVRKIRRFEEVGAFTVGAIIVGLLQGISVPSLFLSWPLVFFGTMMLTEPRTAPAMKREQILFGAGVGALFMTMFALGPIVMSPELALMIGNVFAYAVSSRQVLRLKFKSMTCETEQVCNFAFEPNQVLRFEPGQYLEWTLPLQKTDDRGNRRFFTIASAPSEQEIHLGVRMDREHGSSFKQQLLAMKLDDELVASHLAGEFTMPKDPAVKMVWIAGGIGITPFRSMIRELLVTKQKRDAILFCCINTENDCAYKAEFDEMCSQVGVQMSCVVAKPSETWQGKSGFITKELIEKSIPDYKSRTFYFSGPPMMVNNYAKLVKSMGLPKKQIKTDYFPGF